MDFSIVYHVLGIPLGMPLTEKQWAEYYRLRGVEVHTRHTDGVVRDPIPTSRRSPQGSYRTSNGAEHFSPDRHDSVRDYSHQIKPAKPREGRWMKNQFVKRDRLPRLHAISGMQA